MMKSSSLSSTCSNCHTPLSGYYCSECGQKNTAKKTNWKDAFGAMASGLFSMERGILSTLFQVVKDPKKVAEVYWTGGRYFYQSPGQMIFFVIFICGLHLLFVNSRLLGFNVKMDNVPHAWQGIFNLQVLFIAFLLPLLSITTWICFRRAKKSFPEHFISAVYVFSSWAILLTVFADFLSLLIDLNYLFVSTAFLLFNFSWNARVYLNQPKIFKILGYSVLQFLLMLLIILLLFIPLVYLGIANATFQ